MPKVIPAVARMAPKRRDSKQIERHQSGIAAPSFDHPKKRERQARHRGRADRKHRKILRLDGGEREPAESKRTKKLGGSVERASVRIG
jgi:hypothetical protein